MRVAEEQMPCEKKKKSSRESERDRLAVNRKTRGWGRGLLVSTFKFLVNQCVLGFRNRDHS
jgi:hypothetical protein